MPRTLHMHVDWTRVAATGTVWVVSADPPVRSPLCELWRDCVAFSPCVGICVEYNAFFL